MSNATRGTVLAGRYRLVERVDSNPDGSVWHAMDSTLDRKVLIRVMRPGHPFAADVADAARRAALIDDSRLVRVLDVGTDGDTAFVVNEFVAGDTLATLVERTPISPSAVRRIVGEVAEGLEGAAARGLHHLRLTPRSVIVAQNGTVKVVGLAVEAAAAGLEPDHAATASRVDAIALVGLLYSGLTGRWPLGDAGFPPAPRGENGGPVPPADLVRDVPDDLDTLCQLTLGPHDDGPRSPADLVRELSPWPSIQEAPLRALGRPADHPDRDDRPTAPLLTRSAAAQNLATANPPAPAGAPPAALPLGHQYRSPTFDDQTDESDQTDQTPTDPAVRMPGGSRHGSNGAASVGSNGSAGASAGARPIAGFGAAAEVAGSAGGPLRSGSRPPNSRTVRPANARKPNDARKLGRKLGSGPRPMGAHTSTTETGPAYGPGGSPSSAGRAALDADRPPAGRPDGRPATGPRSGRGNDPAGPTGSQLLFAGFQHGSEAPSGLESTGPFPIVIPAQAPPRGQSRLVIMGVAAVLVLGLIVATFSLRDFGGRDSPTADITPTVGAPVIAPTADPTTPSPAATPAATAAAPVIASIRAIDPQGDGDEDSADTPKAIDDNPATQWRSDTYSTAEFGGLKHGLGLAFRLKSSTVVHSATIELAGGGGAVQLRTASGPTYAGSTLVGNASIGSDGSVTVHAGSAPASRYLILWFTKLPSVNGDYRLEISEVHFS